MVILQNFCSQNLPTFEIMSCCQRFCCLHSACCKKCTPRTFVISSSLPLLIYLSVIVGSSFAMGGLVNQYFSVDANVLDWWTVVCALGVCSLLFLVNTSSCLSMCSRKWSACPCMYSLLSLLVSLLFGVMFFVEVLLVTTTFTFGSTYVRSGLSFLQQTCCVDYLGARACYPFYDACGALQQRNITFQTTVTEELVSQQYFVLGGTLFVALLWLTLTVSSGRLGCMIACGPNENENEKETGVMYIMDAFVSKRNGNKIPPIIYSGDKPYNIDSWPRR